MDILGLPQAQHDRMQRCSGSSSTQPNLPAGAHRRRCRGIESWALLPCTSPAVQTSPAGRLFPRQSPGRRECGWAGRTDSSHGPAAVVGCLMGRGGRRQGMTNAALVAVTDRASRQQQDRLAQPCASAHQALNTLHKGHLQGHPPARACGRNLCWRGSSTARCFRRTCLHQPERSTNTGGCQPACLPSNLPRRCPLKQSGPHAARAASRPAPTCAVALRESKDAAPSNAHGQVSFVPPALIAK